MSALLSGLSTRDVILIAFTSSLLACEAFSLVIAYLQRKQRELVLERLALLSKLQCSASERSDAISLRSDALSKRCDLLSKRIDLLTDDTK